MSGKKITGILCLGLAMLLVISAIISLISGAGPALGDASGLGVSRAVGAFLPAAVALILGLWLLKKPNSHATSMTEGDVYSIDNGDGTFGVVKILKLEPGIVHV